MFNDFQNEMSKEISNNTAKDNLKDFDKKIDLSIDKKDLDYLDNNNDVNKLIKFIKEEFGDIAAIWHVKGDKNSFIIFEQFADVNGIYYDCKSGKSSKDFVDCMVLQDTCKLIYKKNE